MSRAESRPTSPSSSTSPIDTEGWPLRVAALGGIADMLRSGLPRGEGPWSNLKEGAAGLDPLWKAARNAATVQQRLKTCFEKLAATVVQTSRRSELNVPPEVSDQLVAVFDGTTDDRQQVLSLVRKIQGAFEPLNQMRSQRVQQLFTMLGSTVDPDEELEVTMPYLAVGEGHT